MTRTHYIVLDALVFQGLWWSAALLRDQALPVMGVLLLMRHYFSPQPHKERVLALTLAPLGWLMSDGVFVGLGIVQFTSTQVLPLWMLALWIGLVWSFSASLQWLQRLPWWALSTVGAISGGLSYYAAAQLGALTITGSIIGVMGVWAIVLPIQLYILQVLTRTFHYDNY